MKVKSESEVTQLCLTLSDHMDCSLPGSSIHGIFQARVGRRYSKCEIPKAAVVGLACVEEQAEVVENELTEGMGVILRRDPLVIVSFKH